MKYYIFLLCAVLDILSQLTVNLTNCTLARMSRTKAVWVPLIPTSPSDLPNVEIPGDHTML